MGIWARFEIIFSPLIIGFPVSGIEERQKINIYPNKSDLQKKVKED